MNEKIYQDFTENILPQLQEGLTITKDYFIDLFGRYVQYLIVTDIIAIVLLAIIIGLCVFGIVTIVKKNDELDGEFHIFLFLLGGIAISSVILTNISFDLVKAIYVPEV